MQSGASSPYNLGNSPVIKVQSIGLRGEFLNYLIIVYFGCIYLQKEIRYFSFPVRGIKIMLLHAGVCRSFRYFRSTETRLQIHLVLNDHGCVFKYLKFNLVFTCAL